MEVEHIRALYEYNRWANARILDAASRLTKEEFTRDMRSSHRSVRDTLTHILSAEWIYLRRWNGISPRAMLDPVDFPTISQLRVRWAEVEREQMEFVSNVSEESLRTIIAYVNTKGEQWAYPLWQIMQHVVNHSTYHRGQVTTMLRQLGAQPIATDFLLYYDEKSAERR